MPRDARMPDFQPTDKHHELVEGMRELLGQRLPAEATFEERQREVRRLVHELIWLDEELEIQALVTTAKRVEIEGKEYIRLEQESSSTLHGLVGTHVVPEKLYREAGVRNGPTVKPIELRIGAVTRAMLPDLGRIAGLLHAYMPSREVERVLLEMGCAPPSRAFLDGHLRDMGMEIADRVEVLEQAARETEATMSEPEVASVSCGLDRMAVRMDEELSPERAAAKASVQEHRARKVYKRSPPPPAEYNWRMMWVASMTSYDTNGTVLRTRRYASEPSGEPADLIRRVTADVRSTTERHPGIPVVCVQDGAKEFEPLPAALHRELSGRNLAALPDELLGMSANSGVYDRTDVHHLMSYLEAVVTACEPSGDPDHMGKWYHDELLRADDAIDRIYRSLRRRRAQLPDEAKTSDAVALDDALSYIDKRRPMMRYATLHEHNLTIGSGATESTCALIQLRTKRPGMAWEVRGLRGVIAIRALVLSDRWSPAWAAYRTGAPKEVRRVA